MLIFQELSTRNPIFTVVLSTYFNSSVLVYFIEEKLSQFYVVFEYV